MQRIDNALSERILPNYVMEKRRCVRVFISFFHEVKLGRLLVDCSMGKFACLYRVTRSINGFTLQCSSELLA